MHRSRLSTLLIDVPHAERDRATTFWAAALGTEPRVGSEPEFTGLPGVIPGIVTAIQDVDDDPRYHVDLETDDVAAEVARLETLGAVEIGEWQGCHTLRAPGGHLLCVIPVHSDPDEFARAAQAWPDVVSRTPREGLVASGGSDPTAEAAPRRRGPES